jgi:hypothetical protein
MCEQEQCCTPIAKCQNTLDCQEMHDCVAACPPSRRAECEQRCAPDASAVAQGFYYAMRACLDDAVQCATACAPDAGPDADANGR